MPQSATPQTQRLQLANRIRLSLLRETGHGIDVKQMLEHPLYAREVLLVCDTFAGTALQRWAQQFRQATEALVQARRAGAVPQPTPWSTTSGFGSSAPVELEPPKELDRGKGHWFSPRRWLGR